ncbi:Retrovirus-related Pol polyprotein from transposon TNT 1-94 [Linum grandiflorum]
MVSEPANVSFSDSIGVRFNGENYAIWEFSFRAFIQGKGLLSYLDGSSKLPTTSLSLKSPVQTWNINNARVLSYLIGSIESSIALTLRSFPSAAAIWNHLHRTYSHVNTSRIFDLEYALANLTQGELSINDYYLAATHLWTELDMISTSLDSDEINQTMLKERNRSRSFQFLMRLRPEYEQIRSRLIAEDKITMDDILGELIRAETRFVTQAQLDASVTSGAAFATGRFRPQFNNKPHQQATGSSSSIPTGSNSSGTVKCNFCHEIGHPQSIFRKRNICNYCKKHGHIISDCRAPGRRGNTYGRGATSYATQSSFVPSILGTPGSDTSSIAASDSSLNIAQLVQAELARALPQALNFAFASLGMTGTSSSRLWFVDSAAFNHMSGDFKLFQSYTPLDHQSVEVANGQQLPIAGIGTVQTSNITLPATLHVPHLIPNLVSVGQLSDSGYNVTFGTSGCVIQDRQNGKIMGMGSKQGRNYQLMAFKGMATSATLKGSGSNKIIKDSSDNTYASIYSVKPSSEQLWHLWHSRLGHPHSGRLLSMFRKRLLPAASNKTMHQFSVPDCLHCVEAKTVALPFYSSSTEIHDPFELVHTDVWGPSPVTSRLGYCYFVLFIDHKTRYTWVYFLRLKSELCQVLQEFVTMVRTQFDRSVKMFRSDPGGEFTSHALHKYFREHGILFQQSCPGVSEQNGLVERKHRHILDLTRALLLESRVPSHFWVETVRTVVYLVNRQPTPVLAHRSPFETLYDRKPNYARLRVFGCTCFVLLPKKDRTKLTAKTARCVFIGYTDHHKGYLCYDPILRRIHTAYHVIFLEHNFYYHNPPAPIPISHQYLPSFPDFSHDDLPLHPLTPTPIPTNPEPSTNSTPNTQFESLVPPISPTNTQPTATPTHHNTISSTNTLSPQHNTPPRRSSRPNRGQLPSRYTDYITYSTASVPIPTTYKQAHGHAHWDQAMKEELQALHDNNTWTIVPRPPSATVIGSKWVYTAKFHPDGSLERYKARLVAQGYRQEFGIDYDETFAPVAKMQTVRVLLALAAQTAWPLYQLDVKNAFLHGNLKETVYMECPPGFDKPSPDSVCLLHRSLYGLKQAPRAWFETFQALILTSGFQQSKNDPSLFTKTTTCGITVLLLYVDDMILTGSDDQGISEICNILNSQFMLKELGELSYFLGLQVTRSAKGVFVTQQKYIDDLLTLACMADCKPCQTPMELNLKLGKDEGGLVPDPTLYRRLVGSLIYLTSTRPDLAYAVQVVSQFMATPRLPHQSAVFRILRYLQGTRDLGLFFPSSGTHAVSAHADADYAGCIDTRRSTSGWCVTFGDAFISWRCKKQDRVAKSSTEAEYRSMSDVCSEVVWLIRLLAKLGVSVPHPVSLFGDNTSAIQIAANPVFHDRTKHIETHVHYIRDLVHDDTIRLHYVTSEEQVADLLTKTVSASRHWYLSGKLMLRTHHQFEGGC